MIQKNNDTEPLKVSGPEALEWSDSAETVVVGFGCAGSAAALEAREQGSSVIILDRFDGGGATAYSGGVVYAGNTPQQRQAGFNDSPENMFNYLSQEIGDAVRPETLRRFCDESADNIAWLEQHGVPFSGELFEGKTTYPPNGKFLYYSGSEKIEHFTRFAKPAPRGHKTCGTGLTGKVFFAELEKSVASAGIRKLAHTRATRLVVDHSNRVIGLEVLRIPPQYWKKHRALYKKVIPFRPFTFNKHIKAIHKCAELEAAVGETCFIRVEKGLVLSTGGFAYNMELLKQYMPACAANASRLLRLGTPGCDGSGILLGHSMGGQLRKMEQVYLGRIITPPMAILKGIIVNRQGRRFINEDTYNGTLGEAISHQTDGQAWMVLDSKMFWEVVRDMFPRTGVGYMQIYVPAILNILFGGTKTAKSLSRLAEKCGVDPQALIDEVASYNTAATEGREDPQEKHYSNVAPLTGNRFYAMNMGMDNHFSFMACFTLGGLAVDEETGEVVGEDGNPIKGLYAAGRTAFGLCGNGYNCSGLSLADGIFSGRRAGKSCANL